MHPFAPNTGEPGATAPSSRLPSKQTLEYLKIAIELLLLLLAIPWLLRELVRHPAQLSRKAASRHLH